MARFTDKVVVVTGGARGQGRASSLAFAAEGAKVVVDDILDNGGQETVEMMRRNGGEAINVLADVRKTDDVRRLMETAASRYGRIDVLHNNAGISGGARLADYPEEDFDNIIATNLRGVFLGMKYAIPIMLENGGGAIVNTASIGGVVPNRTSGAYCASKAGVLQLTRVAAQEYGKKNIRVNAVCPGVVDTPMLLQKQGKEREGLLKAVSRSVGRLATPEEIAKVVLFLASDEASYVNGASLFVDGALIATH